MKLIGFRFVVGIVLIVGLSGCHKSADEPAPNDAAATPQVDNAASKRAQFDGFSFELPSGWSRISPDRPKTKAALLLGGERWDVAKGMVKVDVGNPTFPDPRATAEGLAKNFGGSILPETADVDGEPGIQVQATSQSTALSPSKAIVIFRGGKVYLIMAGAVAGTDVADAFEHIRRTWKWAE